MKSRNIGTLTAGRLRLFGGILLRIAIRSSRCEELATNTERRHEVPTLIATKSNQRDIETST